MSPPRNINNVFPQTTSSKVQKFCKGHGCSVQSKNATTDSFAISENLHPTETDDFCKICATSIYQSCHEGSFRTHSFSLNAHPPLFATKQDCHRNLSIQFPKYCMLLTLYMFTWVAKTRGTSSAFYVDLLRKLQATYRFESRFCRVYV